LTRSFRHAALPGWVLLACLAACAAEIPGDSGNVSISAERVASPVPPAASPAIPTGEVNASASSGQIQREILAAEGAPPDGPAGTGASVRRCGWLSNPTPGNWWLFDGHGEWILAVQGGYQAAGLDDMPDMTTAGWEEVNRHYGYGCACMTLTVDPATRKVTRIANARPKPLKQCHDDRRLPRP
jgi:hypothetical protein